ncbi:bifunctional tetrahydrofolate synthase/dihydrofolate synthase [Aliidiomarina quisquiliarum]|uniref:bifunctional tetrahydrofolate synthase/dihydrofolate synthase n=1 Tax=Aliidiomarina quisquiliarum TaxID=2938947 RepID=UPI00208E075F|nr:bifunctional tetrahydrofolate synthase/dihydrofolate synthase [Aliidiomarina quisquiliarum]MCO4322034.1 bifunctional tetrahydrofolate synthase/dihydrofolate synthase [Aliidiomarina quisquiliarum]
MNTPHAQEQPRSLDAWLSYLENIHSKEIDMGLDRIVAVAQSLRVLQPSPKVITVAGTNGKGSSVAMLDAILQHAGYSTACYTSPHLVDYRERVLVNGKMLTEQEHCEAFSAVNAARGSTSLTYFEFGTLAALWLIQKHQVDVAILEIGLGGRLDAVNIVDADLSIVTSVDIDHVGFLGNDRENIGFEKAGIFRAGKPAICGDRLPPQRLLAHAQEIGAHLLCVQQDYDLEKSEQGWNFILCSELAKQSLTALKNLPEPQLPVVNALGVIAGLQHAGFKVSANNVAQGLQTATVAGRFEIWPGEPKVILDVAHNPHAARYLRDKLQALREQTSSDINIIAVCGMLADKDIHATLAELTLVIDSWHVATLPGTRAAQAAHLAGVLTQLQCRSKQFVSVANAFEQALAEAKPNDVIVCFGSFLTITAMYACKGRTIGGE